MVRPTYIFGHLNPDTDSICSSIAYCELKKQIGDENVEVYRLGDLNKETKFVLDYFGLPTPPLLKNVKPQLIDLTYYKPFILSKEDTIKKVWDDLLTSANRNRLAAVLDDDGKLEGLISIGDITKLFMEYTENVLNDYSLNFLNLIEALEGEIVTGIYPSVKIKGSVYGESQVLNGKPINKDDIVITANTINLSKYVKEVGCVIVTDNMEIDSIPDFDCCIVKTKHSIFKAINALNQSVSVGSVMTIKGFEYFVLDNFIEDVIDATKTSTHRNFPVLDNEGRFVGIISRRHLIDYERKKVILIDHNEKKQSVEGIEHASIVEIIDHHRVANINTMTPLFIRSEPVGSTSTIIFKMYTENFLRPTKYIAGIMLSAILSDTLMFNSPTCTKEDREAAYKLSKLAEVDLEDYGEKMFKESASLEGYTASEILLMDRKEFSLGKYSASISQVITLDFKIISEIKLDLIKEMESMVLENRYDLIILLVTDIVKNGSEIIVIGPAKELVYDAFEIPRDESRIYLQGVVSRKKQVVPKLHYASQIKY